MCMYVYCLWREWFFADIKICVCAIANSKFKEQKLVTKLSVLLLSTSISKWQQKGLVKRWSDSEVINSKRIWWEKSIERKTQKKNNPNSNVCVFFLACFSPRHSNGLACSYTRIYCFPEIAKHQHTKNYCVLLSSPPSSHSPFAVVMASSSPFVVFYLLSNRKWENTHDERTSWFFLRWFSFFLSFHSIFYLSLSSRSVFYVYFISNYQFSPSNKSRATHTKQPLRVT